MGAVAYRQIKEEDYPAQNSGLQSKLIMTEITRLPVLLFLVTLAACSGMPRHHRQHGTIAMLCSHWQKMDANHDGKVDFGEYSDYLDHHHLQNFNPWFADIDVNNDGYIEPAECK